jgi:hypothetical protein
MTATIGVSSLAGGVPSAILDTAPVDPERAPSVRIPPMSKRALPLMQRYKGVTYTTFL